MGGQGTSAKSGRWRSFWHGLSPIGKFVTSAVAILGSIAAISGAVIGGIELYRALQPPPQSGEITFPTTDTLIPESGRLTVRGSTANIDKGNSIWLIAQLDGKTSPIAVSSELVPNQTRWSRDIRIDAPIGVTFALKLLAGKQGDSKDVPKLLFIVEGLRIAPPAESAQFFLSPKALGDAGEFFRFSNGSGGGLTASFTEAAECHRQTRQWGILADWVGAKGVSGGFGVLWNASSVGHVDLAAYKSLALWVQGKKGGETFEIEGPRVFRTVAYGVFYAASCRFRYSS